MFYQSYLIIFSCYIFQTGQTIQPTEKADGDEDAEYEDVSDSDNSDIEVGKPVARFNTHKKKNKSFKPLAHHFKCNKPSNKPSKKIKKDRVVKPDVTVEVEAEFTTSWAKVMWQVSTHPS